MLVTRNNSAGQLFGSDTRLMVPTNADMVDTLLITHTNTHRVLWCVRCLDVLSLCEKKEREVKKVYKRLTIFNIFLVLPQQFC